MVKIETTKNKRGWIRIVEAFIAILLVSGVVLIIVNQGQVKQQDLSARIYSAQLSVLREIQLNDTARSEILNVNDANLPLNWSDFETYVPTSKEKIDARTPSYLECVGKLCAADDLCLLGDIQDVNIYAEYVVISSNLDIYNPRILKIFCWTK